MRQKREHQIDFQPLDTSPLKHVMIPIMRRNIQPPKHAIIPITTTNTSSTNSPTLQLTLTSSTNQQSNKSLNSPAIAPMHHTQTQHKRSNPPQLVRVHQLPQHREVPVTPSTIGHSRTRQLNNDMMTHKQQSSTTTTTTQRKYRTCNNHCKRTRVNCY